MLYYSNTLVATSDDRVKSHEVAIENANKILFKLTPKIYDKHPFFKVDSGIEDTDLSGIEIFFNESGLIAQEVMNDAPELEHLVIKQNDSDGLYGVNYIGLIPYLLKANNELNERLKLLEGNQTFVEFELSLSLKYCCIFFNSCSSSCFKFFLNRLLCSIKWQ